jgi:hypothetical protein
VGAFSSIYPPESPLSAGRGPVRLSLAGPQCKQSASLRARVSPQPRSRALALSACLTWTVLTGCAALSPGPVVQLSELECAPARRPADVRHCFVEEPAALKSLLHPLGRRLGLLEVSDIGQWRKLAQAVPGLGACPDLGQGTIVGLVSLMGTPLDGDPPFQLQAIRIHHGAGLIEAQFNSGTYLPDGTTYLEMTYVRGLRSVLVVRVDGVEYIAEEPGRRSVASRIALVH